MIYLIGQNFVRQNDGFWRSATNILSDDKFWPIRYILWSGHPIIFLKKYGKYGNFFSEKYGRIWAILEFSWQNLAKIWEIWAIFNHFFHIFSIFSTIKRGFLKKKKKKK